ncbi:MAG: thioredoxin family protein [Muribaculaceae bacterium]|nr:thioredoxin family protein [Muribaculaceae bacterium]
MKKIFLSIMVSLVAIFAKAQMLDPIHWSANVTMSSEKAGVITLDAQIDEGWHLYGLSLPEGGPNPTTIDFTLPAGVTLDGEIMVSEKAIEKLDEIFQMPLSWWASDVSFTQKFVVADGVSVPFNIGVSVGFQGCNDETCVAPKTETFDIVAGGNGGAGEASEEGSAGSTANVAAVKDNVSSGLSDLWAPVVFDNIDEQAQISNTGWGSIFIWGFLGGLLALLTPCVWPMIPMTVSFFLKKTSSRSKAIRDALTYGVSIVVIYLVLGLAITLIFGASKLNDLATNAVFNLLFFLLLLVFAISFFGAFNITLPSSWSNSVDSKAEKTSGLLSIFFMAFTLALVSFSCTGPIIGTLLVEAASMGNITGPAIGMGAFALALALPFTLFAIFPSWLKEMPRSGGWLNSVKVVLGFLELALSLKFLSVADLAYGWGILDREVFISLWVVMFVMLGMYLLGKINFSHDTPTEHVSIVRFFLSMISFSFAVYLVPGLWGAPLKSVSAFVPPLYTQDFNLYDGGQFEEFDDYDAGMAYAAANNRPVIIDFSGYGCVNCRKMEGAVFDTEEVEDVIKENFVLIKLMVDDKTKLPQPMEVTENGKKVKLITVGDKWSYLQRMKFMANSQPYYVMLDNEGKPLDGPTYYDEDAAKFVEWLEAGIESYKTK